MTKQNTPTTKQGPYANDETLTQQLGQHSTALSNKDMHDAVQAHEDAVHAKDDEKAVEQKQADRRERPELYDLGAAQALPEVKDDADDKGKPIKAHNEREIVVFKAKDGRTMQIVQVGDKLMAQELKEQQERAKKQAQKSSDRVNEWAKP